MKNTILRLLCLLPLLCAACVGTYDPESTSRYSLDTRAQETRSAPREGLRIFARRAGPAQPPSTPGRFEAERKGIVPPETPAGKQLAWVIGSLNGGNIRTLGTKRFSEQFLKRTPEQEVRDAIIQWRRDELAHGPAEIYSIEDSALSAVTVVIRGKVTDRYSRIAISTDKFGRIGSLSMAPLLEYRPGELSEWSKIDTRLANLGGRAGLAAYELTAAGAKPVHRFQSDQVMSIGAMSGLFIAGALREAVAASKATWDEPIPIMDELKSLVGGRMQHEPEESQFPLIQYLSLMLGGGDATAFDHLLLRAGRDNVENYSGRFTKEPSRNRPFLATMEYYRIKLGSDRSLPAQFGAADETGRRRILSPGGPADKSVPSLAAAANLRLPFEVDRIGWFATADDLSRVLADLALASRAPGMQPLADALRMQDALEPGSATWKTAAFKGASEPGVLAMAWLLHRTDGRWFTLVLLANDPARPVSHEELSALATAAVRLLGERDAKK